MLLAVVTGTVVATRKHQGLQGAKLLLVRPEEPKNSPAMVAVDRLGAGVGDRVLLALGSAARLAWGNYEIPADAAIVGIVDSVEQSLPGKK